MIVPGFAAQMNPPARTTSRIFALDCCFWDLSRCWAFSTPRIAWRGDRALRRFGLIASCVIAILLTGCGERFLVLQPVGPVGRIELGLIQLSAILIAIIVVPVIALIFYVVWKYRERPTSTAPYDPEWSESRRLEIIWWGVPIVIIGILGTVTARDTFALVRPPERSATPVTVEVTSLDWKWLFQYPEAKVATVNYCVIPTNRPIQFILTAHAPMNSFWVPQLGGQEYTMPGMAMRLWLQADRAGDYYGHGANFTGAGYAHMTFHVLARSPDRYQAWLRHVKTTAPPLTESGYRQLVKPGLVATQQYSSYPHHLFERILQKQGGMYMKRDLTIIDQGR